MKIEQAYLGGGCFWCLDAAYTRVKGVDKVVSGHANGAEVVDIHFDPTIIDYKTLLDIFWVIHDPTTLNRQMYDVGPQYRSIILFNSPEQQAVANESMTKTAVELWGDKITTELVPLEKFTPAEDFHQDFYNKNPEQGYCQVIINPKLAKLTKKFAHLLKD